ncbi:hypothetical protein JOD43_001520 [Pullulanibacillus pueri]|uniref:Uncharacterized protein n=1 Tax=Pullulanibacillus pueri TaxID=1437324 RepID=A0A8J2ZTY5_9BACL|nr:HepT-like ribonuclease domain-containing protein [Pullulanibacillus pueri]MBM7681353.1 hypothetical protein [Pullulanibacillus pueri]GGH77483.1 hypothetical protein GCM10007096_09440 [Pullulanibacillus pueri]
MIGIRIILIHEYFGIDLNIVWVVATSNLPSIQPQIQVIYDAFIDNLSTLLTIVTHSIHTLAERRRIKSPIVNSGKSVIMAIIKIKGVKEAYGFICYSTFGFGLRRETSVFF